jgi:hypothetical protein
VCSVVVRCVCVCVGGFSGSWVGCMLESECELVGVLVMFWLGVVCLVFSLVYGLSWGCVCMFLV